MNGQLAEAMEDGQEQKEREDWDSSGRVCARVVAPLMTSNWCPVPAGIGPDAVVSGHYLLPRVAGLRAESSTKVRVPFGLRRMTARPPRLRCHTTMAVAMTAMAAMGIAAGGNRVMVTGMPTAADKAVDIWIVLRICGLLLGARDSRLTKEICARP